MVELNRFVSIKSWGHSRVAIQDCYGPAVVDVLVAWILQVAEDRQVVGKLQVVQVAARFQVRADLVAWGLLAGGFLWSWRIRWRLVAAFEAC